MSKNTRKTPAEKVRIVEESKLVGSIETARKHGNSNKTLKQCPVYRGAVH